MTYALDNHLVQLRQTKLLLDGEILNRSIIRVSKEWNYIKAFVSLLVTFNHQ